METVKFDELQLDERIIRAITEMGLEETSLTQIQATPVAMGDRDMIGQVQTGIGKTAAFGLPLLQKTDPEVKKPQAIVLLSAGELTIQVMEEMCRFVKLIHGVKMLPIYGGQDIIKQIRPLKDGAQVTVGIPGCVMDHMRRKTIKADHVLTVVLDEADEMLNMGSLEDMEIILSQLPEERQTLMFSATTPQAIAEIARKFQRDSVTVRVIKKELIVPKATQYYHEVKPKNKVGVMSHLLDMYAPKLPIVFCNIRRQVDDLMQGLQGRGYFVGGLHGDLEQVQRNRVMDSFRNGRTDILVATDVAARGIDVGDVEVVFNYDIPQDDKYYVHRIDCTGRAGREGKTFSLVIGKEVYKPRGIQCYCKIKIIPQAIPPLNDITEIKVERILSQVQEMLNDMDLTKTVNTVEKRLMGEDYISMDLVAALLKMSTGDESEDTADSSETVRSLDELDSFERGNSRDRGRERGSYGNRCKGATDRVAVGYVLGEGEEKMARLFINIGKVQRITPGDILGAVAGESGTLGRMAGSIDMYDGYTFVDVPGCHVDDVPKATARAKIRGKNTYVEKASTSRR